MLEFITRKVSSYLVFLSVSLLLLAVIPYVISEQQEKHKQAQIKAQEKVKLSKDIEYSKLEIKPDYPANKAIKTREKIIKISNFPVKGGYLSSGFGLRKDPIHGSSRMHSGVDIAAVNGTFVYPMGKGKVIFAGRKGNYGNVLEIQHGNSVVSRYAHLEMLLIEVGREVDKDDIVALVGNTGRSTGPHLHLEVTLNNKKVDPEIFLMGDVASR